MELDLGFIKSRRIKLELTLQNVAEQLGFKNASTYLKYENGDYLFRANMLPRLAIVLDCKVENFFKK